MDLPLVSIIIPVYNTGLKARKLVDRILSSDYKKVEVILVDDGSEDDSYEILKSIKDKKIRLFSKKNEGPSAARNFGIERATGDYLLFIDSDDDIERSFIGKMVNKVKISDTALVSSGIVYKRKNTAEELYMQSFERGREESLEKYVLRSLLADGRMYPAFNKIFDASIIRKYNLRFDEKMDYGEDTKFVLEYIYNVGTETSTAAKAVGVWSNWQKCYRNLKKWVGKKNSFSEKVLLKLIYLKWRASWLKARIS